jgi:hypothetical protein
MRYLHIEFIDGKKEAHWTDGATIKADNGNLKICGDRETYRERGKVEGFPLHNVRRWWLSDEEAG